MDAKHTFPNLEICVINDGSTDQTASIVRQRNVILLDLPHNLGIGGAVQTGYKYAYYHDFDIAVQFDADGQHGETELVKIIEPIVKNEADMVIGSRFVQKTAYKGSTIRRTGIFYFTGLLFLLTGKKYTDPTSGYRAKNKAVIKLFAFNYPRDYPEPEVIIYLNRKQLHVKEVSVEMKDRQGGTSSITPFKSIYYMVKVSISVLMQRIKKGNAS